MTVLFYRIGFSHEPHWLPPFFFFFFQFPSSIFNSVAIQTSCWVCDWVLSFLKKVLRSCSALWHYKLSFWKMTSSSAKLVKYLDENISLYSCVFTEHRTSPFSSSPLFLLMWKFDFLQAVIYLFDSNCSKLKFQHHSLVHWNVSIHHWVTHINFQLLQIAPVEPILLSYLRVALLVCVLVSHIKNNDSFCKFLPVPQT